MNKLLIGLIGVFLLSGCGLRNDFLRGGQKRQFNTSNPAFASYVQKFENNANQELGTSDFKVGDIPINFKDPENPDHDGVCISYINGQTEIFIRKSWWDATSEQQREILIFHELGHCRLGREHNLSTIFFNNQTIKASIMNSTIPPSSHYLLYEEGYISELYREDQGFFQALVESENE